MTKNEFLSALEEHIRAREDCSNIIQYYSEMIDDRVDDGMSEEDAVRAMGSIDGICREYPVEENKYSKCDKNIREKDAPNEKSNMNPVIKTVLTVFYVILAIAVWTFIVSLWIVVVSLCICAVAMLVASFPAFVYSIGKGFIMLGCSLILFGISIISEQGMKVLSDYTKKGMKYLKSQIG